MTVMLDLSSPGDLHQFLKSSRNLRLPAEPHWYSQNGPSDPLQYPQDSPSNPLQYLQSEQSDPLQHPQNEPSDPVQCPQSGPAPKPLREVDALDRFGMTAKKSHEVKRMADVVHHLARSRGAQQVGTILPPTYIPAMCYSITFDCVLLL